MSQNLPFKPTTEQASTSTPLDHQQQLRNAYEEQKKEEEQRQLRAAFEEEKRRKEEREKVAAAVSAVAAQAALKQTTASRSEEQSVKNQEISPAEQLQKSYETHLKTLKKPALNKGRNMPENSSSKVGKDDCGRSGTPRKKNKAAEKPSRGESVGEQPMPDEEAGTVLLGFLNSLRQSYEDAVDDKTTDSGKAPHHAEVGKTKQHAKAKKLSSLSESPALVVDDQDRAKRRGVKRPQTKFSIRNSRQGEDKQRLATAGFMTSNDGRRSQRPASVTDTSSGNSSSQHAEFSSSLEDSSDKTDPSSSEDSDKETAPEEIHKRSRGPPRKRLKSLTKENVRAHTQRANEEVDN